jgi:putative oxidoreductase
MNALQNAAVLLARIMICWWFLPEGIEKILHYGGMEKYMMAHGVPTELLPVAIVTEIACAVFLLIGWKARWFALWLAIYTFLAVLLFHVPPADHVDKIVQMAELVDGAGFLVLWAHGAGEWSLDGILGRRRKGSLTDGMQPAS